MGTADTERWTTLSQARTQEWLAWWLSLYVALWLVDGALRKWLAPGLSDLIYFAKDAATFVAFFVILVSGVPRARVWRLLAGACGLLALAAVTCLQLIVTTQPPVSLAVGFVTYASPVAAVALICTLEPSSRLFEKLSRFALMILPVEAGLTIVQTLTADTSFWNRTGDAGNVGLYTADEVVRATGTFTSPSGLSAYATLCVALLAARLMSRAEPLRARTAVPLASTVIVVALGGSRSAVLGALIVLGGAVAWTFLGRGSALGRLGRLVGSVTVLYGMLRVVILVFPSVTRAFRERFEQAAEEGSRLRLLDSAFSYFDFFDATPFWGDGAGSHTLSGIAAGSTLGWEEIELSRWVAELGVLGLVLAASRQLVALALLAAAWRAARRAGSPTMALVCLALTPQMLYGSITAPASQSGFAVTAVAMLWLAWPRDVVAASVNSRDQITLPASAHTSPTTLR